MNSEVLKNLDMKMKNGKKLFSRFLLISLVFILSFAFVPAALAASNAVINGNTYTCGVSDNVDPERYGATDCKTDPNFCVSGANVIINGLGYECGASDGIDPSAYGATCANDPDSCAPPAPCEGGIQRACPLQLGVCAGVNETCADGAWPGCTAASYGPNYVSVETIAYCDGLDNDCDGAVDEGCSCVSGNTRVCGTDVGECQAGLQTCTAGQWGTCVEEIVPTAEICDNKDNNCNGQIDEGLTQSQSCGLGVCARTVSQTCSAGAWSPACVAGPAGLENTNALCTNTLDDDCDGMTDFPADTNSCTIGAAEELPICQTIDADGDGQITVADAVILNNMAAQFGWSQIGRAGCEQIYVRVQ